MRGVLIANAKGGCGKTTVATTVAAALAVSGARVALADADPQRASLTWTARRPAPAAAVAALDWTRPDDIGAWPAELRPSTVDWLVIDAPALAGPRPETRPIFERLLEQTQAVLTPVAPSFFDAHATLGFLQRLENAWPVRRGRTEIFVVMNRAPGKGRGPARVAAMFENAPFQPVATVSERSIYQDLAAEGLALYDPPRKALEPLRAQWRPVLAAIGA